MRSKIRCVGFASMSLVVVGWCLAGHPAFAQDCEGDDQPKHLVRAIKVKARWLPDLALPLKRRDELTPDKLRETRNEVRKAINAEKEKYNSEFVKLGRLQIVDVNLVRACVRKVPPPTCLAEGLTDKCVDIEMRTLALSTDPVFMASVLLPIPRSNRVTFLSNVPRVLRLFDPKFGVGSDRELGLTPEFEISTDLFSMNEVAAGEPAQGRRAALLLKARGSKSLGEAFYTSEAKLSLVLNQPSKNVQSLGLETSFSADHQPLLTSSYLKNSLRVGGHITLNPALGILNRVALSGGYRSSHDRMFASTPQRTTLTTESSFEARAILEGRIFNGFSRAAVWVDSAKPRASTDSYTRVAALFGYEKEVPIGQHTIGLETLFGLAKASDHTPEYGLFYGGNSLNDFVYQDITEPESLSTFPSGPLLRSFGRNQAGFRANGQTIGANSFQHFNLTIAIPIPGLSAPLIPEEVVIANPRTTLRDLVDFAVNSGQEALSLSLQDEGLSPEKSDEKAAQVFGEIRPGVKYLTHYAKMYSIKPIVMLDQARSSSVGNPTQSRYSLGGGIQLTVVIAKFQAGYVYAVKRFDGEPRGNVVLRMVFSNLF